MPLLARHEAARTKTSDIRAPFRFDKRKEKHGPRDNASPRATPAEADAPRNRRCHVSMINDAQARRIVMSINTAHAFRHCKTRARRHLATHGKEA